MNTVCAWKSLTFIPNSPILDVVLGFYFHGTLVSVIIRKLTFCKSAAVINHKFQGYADTSQYSEAVPRGVLQTCSEFTGEHPRICVVFINLNSRFGCSPVNLLYICRIPFCHFVRKPLEDCF